MDTIKTLVIEPLRRPELRDIDPSITAIGKTIGGYAEPLPLDRRTTLWCDEERNRLRSISKISCR